MASTDAFLTSQRIEFPDLEAKYEEFGVLYERKLWHELSLALEQFLVKGNVRGSNFRRLYEDFITKFDSRLNQVRLALIVSTIGQSFPEPREALELYQNALKAHTKLGPDAIMCLEMDMVLVLLKLGDVVRSNELLEKGKASLAAVSSSETVVFSKFYRATAEYRKVGRAHLYTTMHNYFIVILLPQNFLKMISPYPTTHPPHT